ncbi:MAG: amidohydrolase family protein [Deltaproteobacteria bacterium]|jgi:N-acyl-D-aspartate/D-glutamate deacylase|nr:amidohydrolase family protein [Deltaproteobacteria bacterium]MBW2501048.1 amidohydrolase family protein [Deltaproteobacteria bacterium]
MTYDLLIRDGIVVDGSGMPRVRADVAVEAGRIVRIGRIREAAKRVIDAEGRVVAPGFVDGHTHMDAQICWDPLGTCSSYHGVTSVLMGNCGFTLAPSRSNARDLVVRNLERSEDIAAEAMAEGIDWQWESFPEYLDALDRLPKGIHYGGYVGHSALRTYAMGERAFEERANDDDLEAMRCELRAGLEAGAFGFTTSRSIQHLTPDDRPVASRLADWDEVRSLVEVVGGVPGGLFEIANEDAALTDDDARDDYFARLEQLAIDTGVPTSFGVGSMSSHPEAFREWLQMLDRASLRGARMFAQVHARAFTIMLSFPGQLPFDGLSGWRELRARPLEEQRECLRDPETRERLVRMAHESDYGTAVAAEARKPDFDRIFVMDSPMGPHRCVGELARERGIDPVELMIEMALASDLEQHFLQPLANENPDYVLELMRHPRSVVTFSDAGAHVSQISDCSIPTYVLGHWVRDEQALTLEQAVRMLSFENASAFGLRGRGLVREGFAADLVVFDPERIAPQMPQIAHDLPGGARRLVQYAEGISATVVAGEVLLENGKHTGALPGRLLRRGSDTA